MRRLMNKMRDEWGVTILMALFALLVASMVCVVILGASVTTVKQSKADQEHEQDMLILQSAAELIGDNIGNQATAVSYTVEQTATREDESQSFGTPTVTGRTVAVSQNCLLNDELKAAAEEVLINNPSQDYSSKSFDICVPGEVTIDGGNPDSSVSIDNPRVSGSFTLRCGEHSEQEGTGLNYQFVFTFYLMEGDGDSISQTMYMKMSVIYTPGTETDVLSSDNLTKTTTKTDTYKWGKPEYYLADGTGV